MTKTNWTYRVTLPDGSQEEVEARSKQNAVYEVTDGFETCTPAEFRAEGHIENVTPAFQVTDR